MTRALVQCADHRGRCPKGAKYREGNEGNSGGAAGAWKHAFIEAPYLMNILLSLGMVVDTFETACPWDAFEALHADVVKNVRAAMKEACGGGFITCRFTHVYPDGPAPYFTFIAPATRGAEVAR